MKTNHTERGSTDESRPEERELSTELVTQQTGQVAAFIEFPLIKEPGSAEEHRMQREARNKTDALRKRADDMFHKSKTLEADIAHWATTKEYRAMGYETFREWVEQELGMTRQYANRLMNAERVRGFLPAAAAVGLKEGHTRVISDLEPEEAVAVIEKAKEIAEAKHTAKPPTGEAAKFDKGPKVTAKTLSEARAALFPDNPKGDSNANARPVESETDNTDQEKVYNARFDSITFDKVDKLLIHEATVKIGKVFYRIRLSGGKARYTHVADELQEASFFGKPKTVVKEKIVKVPTPAKGKAKAAATKPAVSSFTPDADPEPAAE